MSSLNMNMPINKVYKSQIIKPKTLSKEPNNFLETSIIEISTYFSNDFHQNHIKIVIFYFFNIFTKIFHFLFLKYSSCKMITYYYNLIFTKNKEY